MLRSNRILFVLVLSIALSGCRTPPLSFNPFAGFGSPRVPPPPTGSYGTPPNTYYPGATPPAGSASRTPNVQQYSIPGSVPSLGQSWQPSGSGSSPGTSPSAQAFGTVVQPNAAAHAGFVAPFNSPMNTTVNPGGTANVMNSPANSGAAGLVQLNPMKVNDATQPAVPGRFTPPNNIQNMARLPNPIRPALPQSNRVRGFSSPSFLGVAPNSVTPASGGTYVAAGAAPSALSTPPPAATNVQNGIDGWHPKYVPSVGGTVIR